MVLFLPIVSQKTVVFKDFKDKQQKNVHVPAK